MHAETEPYPLRCKIVLPDDRGGTGYPVGFYEIDIGRSFEVGKFERLQLGRGLVLKAVSAPAGMKAA